MMKKRTLVLLAVLLLSSIPIAVLAGCTTIGAASAPPDTIAEQGAGNTGSTNEPADEDTDELEPTPPPVVEFEDVSPDDWFYRDVRSGLRSGIIQGVGGGRFEPNRNVTRAEFITMLGRLHEYRNETIGTPGVGAFYERYLDWAVELGIIHGNQHGDLMPQAFVTREQMVVIVFRYVETFGLWRYVQFYGYTIPRNYDDEHLASYWAQGAIGALGEERLIRANPEFGVFYFRPLDYAIRAEALAILVGINMRIRTAIARHSYD